MKKSVYSGLFFLLTMISLRIMFIVTFNYSLSIFWALFLMIGLSIFYGGLGALIGRGVKNIPVRGLHAFLVLVFSIVFFLMFISALTWTIMLYSKETFATHLIIPVLSLSYFYFAALRYSDNMHKKERIYKEETFIPKDTKVFEEKTENVFDDDDPFETYYKNKK